MKTCSILSTKAVVSMIVSVFVLLGNGSEGWATSGERSVVNVISRWNAQFDPQSNRVKYKKMTASPFAFFRGTNHLFWNDFATDTRLTQFGNSQTRIWIQGDLHAENFGTYDTAQGEIIYDLNDFDEAVIADYQYDLWRMAVSIVLIARQLDTFSVSKQKDILDAFAKSYVKTIGSVVDNNKETQAVLTKKNAKNPLKSFLKQVEEKKSRRKMVKKWTKKVKGVRQFDLSLKGLAKVSPQKVQEILGAMTFYGATLHGNLKHEPAYVVVKSLAQRLGAGTGSLGVQRYYILIEGENDEQTDDCILDVKAQIRPTPYHFLGQDFQQEYNTLFINDAERHAVASRVLSSSPNAHLGWMTLSDGSYSVTERSPYKDSFPIKSIDTKKQFLSLAKQWGVILAMAHARSDNDAAESFIPYSFEEQFIRLVKDRQNEFLALVREIAFEYADRVESDWFDFVRAKNSLKKR